LKVARAGRKRLSLAADRTSVDADAGRHSLVAIAYRSY